MAGNADRPEVGCDGTWKHYEVEVLQKKLFADVKRLDHGWQILLGGGDRSHIGAVAVVDEAGEDHLIAFAGHKEADIARDWAKKVYVLTKEPVCLTAGVHYDDLEKQDLLQVIDGIAQLWNKVAKGWEA